jgi:hypothetical protein
MLVLNLLLLLNHMICMLITLERAMGEITRGTSSLHSLVLVSYLSFGLSLAFHFVFRVMVLAIGFLLDFFVLAFSS